MSKRKLVTSKVEVYYVKGETMAIAFKNFNNEYSLDNYYLHQDEETLSQEDINSGKILNISKRLFGEYFNNKLSEFAVIGALFNKKPILKDESRIIHHNIVIKGTKKWVTTNAFVTDGGEVVKQEVGTKEDAKNTATELSLEHNRTINVVATKVLQDSDGIIYIAEFIPADFVDDSNVYVFWKYVTTVTEVDEDELIEDSTEVDKHGQIAIKDNTHEYFTTKLLKEPVNGR